MRSGPISGETRDELQALAEDESGASEKLRNQSALLRALTDALSLRVPADEKHAPFEKLLDGLLSVSRSEWGLIGQVSRDHDGSPYLETRAASDMANDEASESRLAPLFEQVEKVMASGEPVIANDAALAEGRSRARGLMVVPVKNGTEIVGVVAVKNRPGGYDDEVLKCLEPLVAAYGNILAAHEAVRDKRRAEEQIASLARFPDENPDAVLRVSADGNILYANDGSRFLLECWGSDVGRPVPPDWRRIVSKTMASGCREEELVELGERVYRLDLVPAADAGHIHIYGRDVTERRRLEEELRHKQKMESVGRLAGGVAHDFNNILTAISMQIELTTERLAPDDPLRENLAPVRLAAQRAADLTQQLLAFSRKQALAPRIVDLNDVIARMDVMLRRVIGEQIDIRIRLGRDLFPVKVDPAQIEQVIVNLAINARDAMPGGGTLKIETTNAERAPHRADKSGASVELSVSDTGSGMSAAVRAKIFEPFFTTKEQGKGTGLGLATVHGIVGQSGGSISVDSQPGSGATFTIRFPAAEGELDEIAIETEPAVDPAKGESILVVEDDDFVREATVKMLSQHGYTVEEVANGADAYLLCEARGEPFDLVLTDIVMPRMGGHELITNLRRIWPELRALYMSGYAARGILETARDSGDHFLQKPFESNALLAKVRESLDA